MTHTLAEWIDHTLLPLFVLFNVHIHFTAELLAERCSRLALGIVAGLAIGKPLRFIGFAAIASRLRGAAGGNELADGEGDRRVGGDRTSPRYIA